MLVLSCLKLSCLKLPTTSLLGLSLVTTGCWLQHKKLESSISVAGVGRVRHLEQGLLLQDGGEEGTNDRSPNEGRAWTLGLGRGR